MILEVANLDGLVVILFLIMFGPALLFLIIGGILFAKQKKKAGKVFMILAGVYLLVSLGVCGTMMS
jgi:drug/metabolite transporter superfamily protein YnfA